VKSLERADKSYDFALSPYGQGCLPRGMISGPLRFHPGLRPPSTRACSTVSTHSVPRPLPRAGHRCADGGRSLRAWQGARPSWSAPAPAGLAAERLHTAHIQTDVHHPASPGPFFNATAGDSHRAGVGAPQVATLQQGYRRMLAPGAKIKQPGIVPNLTVRVQIERYVSLFVLKYSRRRTQPAIPVFGRVRAGVCAKSGMLETIL